MKRILSVLLAFVLLGGLAVTPVMAWDSHNFKYAINNDVIYDKELNNSTDKAQSIKSGQTVRGTLTVPGSWKGISNGTTVMDDFCDMDYFEFTLNERSDILVAAVPESYCNQDYMVITVSDRNDTTISKSFSNGNDSPDQVVAMITDTLDAGTYYITFFCGVDDTKYNGASYIGYFEAIPAENSNVGSGSLADKFNDCSEINPNYIEAVNYAVSKNIIAGYVDNTFKPQVKLNRGAASKFIAYLCLGSDVASKLSVSTAPFPDVPTDNTFAGYIGYCAYAGIINGYSDGKYKITAPLSAAAFGKMLLTAIQYPTETSGYTGTGWKENVYSDGAEIGIFKGNMDFGLDDVLTREQAAFMLFNAMTWVDKHGDHFQPIMPPSELTNPVTPTIPQYPTGITFTASSLNIKQNSGGSLKVSITPSNATNKSIMWSSSNRSVATVDSAGYVWGISAGTATITATTANGLTASYTVTVTGAEKSPTTGTAISGSTSEQDVNRAKNALKRLKNQLIFPDSIEVNNIYAFTTEEHQNDPYYGYIPSHQIIRISYSAISKGGNRIWNYYYAWYFTSTGALDFDHSVDEYHNYANSREISVKSVIG